MRLHPNKEKVPVMLPRPVSPFGQSVEFATISQTSPPPGRDSSSARIRQQTECEPARAKCYCSECCPSNNPWRPNRSSKPPLPCSSNKQNGRIVPSMRQPTLYSELHRLPVPSCASP